MDPVRPRRARPPWYLEVALLGGGYLVFGLVRAAIDRGDPAATADAGLVQHVEQVLGLAVEHPLNQAALAHPVALYLSGYFYRLCLLAVPAVLVWLYTCRPQRYRPLRTVLVVTTLLDLPLVWLFPESPPRFALAGVVDYIATHDILFGAGTRIPGSGLNLLAAMPSMHVAWTTWCAYAVWSALHRSRPRGAWLAWLLPLLTALDVLVTGHHYVLDIVGGVAVVAFAVGVTGWAARRRGTSGAEPGHDGVRRR